MLAGPADSRNMTYFLLLSTIAIAPYAALLAWYHRP